MTFALFKDDKQISKAHSTREAAETEAFEVGAVVTMGRSVMLAKGYEIREMKGHP